MGKVLLTLLGFIALGCACRPAGAAAPQQMLLLPDGVVLYGGARALVTKGKVIGFAFAPTNLIACCLQEGDRGGVFLISRDSRSRYTVWQAPPGVSVSGPLRWSPDGHRTAFRQLNEDGTAELLVAEYLGKKPPKPILKQSPVEDYLWSPDGEWLACLLRGSPWPALGIVSSSGGDLKSLAAMAADVRWSRTGKSLTWLEPSRSGKLKARRHDIAAETTPMRLDQPTRPAASVWSPDGLLCAAMLSYDQASVFEGAGAVGRPLAGVKASRLLSWSPDSKVLVGLDSKGQLLLASSRPEVTANPASTRSLRARGVRHVLVLPLRPDIGAGIPSWSVDGRELVVSLGTGEGGFYSYPLVLVRLPRSPLPAEGGALPAPELGEPMKRVRSVVAMVIARNIGQGTRIKVADLPPELRTELEDLMRLLGAKGLLDTDFPQGEFVVKSRNKSRVHFRVERPGQPEDAPALIDAADQLDE